MLDFEAELKHFEPSREIEEAEDAINCHDLNDVTDFVREMLEEIRKDYRR